MDKLYSIREAHSISGISIPMFKKLIQHKQISYVKVGNKNFIKESTLEEYINNRTVEGSI